MVDIANARSILWEDAVDVEFDDGLSFLEPHRATRKANGIGLETATASSSTTTTARRPKSPGPSSGVASQI
jgi:hypothetical protein